MTSSRLTRLPKSGRTKPAACLSCGRELSRPRRRYCSDACRMKLEAKLNLAVGLLNALNARFAAFSFSDSIIDLHLQPENADVFTFSRQRNPGAKPAQDLWRLVESLGEIWHRRLKVTGRRYLASRHVLEQGIKNSVSRECLVPSEDREPCYSLRSVRKLGLTLAVLVSPQAKNAVRAAYRREAKRHHPDRGGDAAHFRDIHTAQQELLNWIDNPRYMTRRGIPGKWSYDRRRPRKWLPPQVVRKRGTGRAGGTRG